MNNSEHSSNFDVLKDYECSGQINMTDLYRIDGKPRAFYRRLKEKQKNKVYESRDQK